MKRDGKRARYYYYSVSLMYHHGRWYLFLDISLCNTKMIQYLVDGYYYYNGYADLDTLKYKTVTANLDNYTYEEKFD